MYKVQFSKQAGKDLRNLPKTVIKRVIIASEGLAKNPQPNGCKKLRGTKENLYRVRVGDYRIIYVIEETIRIVTVRNVRHRKDVYRL